MSRKRVSPEVRKSRSPKVKKKAEAGGPKPEEKNNSKIGPPHSEINKSETAAALLSTVENIRQRKIEHPKSERGSPLEHHKKQTNSEKITMEVHHHPEVEKKGLKEYLLEGLMIFIAVMMGFFAESLREHLADRERETEYMQGMVIDLRKDSVEINAEIVYVNQEINALDSLFRCLHAPKLTDSVQRRLYQLNMKSNVLVGIEFSDAASVQLKNTGGLRLIQNQKVANAIIHYWQTSEGVKADMNVFNGKAETFWDEGLKIFDLYNNKNITQSKAKITGLQIEPNARLLTLDKLQLTEYANRAGSLIVILRKHYLVSLLKQKVIESDLDQLINTTYRF